MPKRAAATALVTFTVKTTVYVVVLYYRDKDGGLSRLQLIHGIARKSFPAGSDQRAVLFLHGDLNQQADFTIEQETASGRILLAERLGIAVTEGSGTTVEVPFTLAGPDGP